MTGIWIDANRPGSAGADNSGRIWLANYYATTAEPKWETRDYTNTVTGYNNQSTPGGSGYTYLSINYYDDYNFPAGNPSYPYSYNSQVTDMPTAQSTMTKGLLTGSKINVLGTGDMLWTVNYYDDKGRVIQTNEQHYLGGTLNNGNYDQVSNGYDFTNAVTQTIRKHYNTSSASPALTVANNYVYDHMGRKRQSWEQINNGTHVLLSQTDYNEIGQLKTKSLHSANGTDPFLQSMTYAYNERGWLRQINDPAVAPTNDKLFSLQLLYTDPVAGHGSGGAQYNGNIAEQVYNKGAVGQKFAAYVYDPLNRLTAGNSVEGFSESPIQYDLEGNITSMQRYGPYAGLLTYNYYAGTNQLQAVTSDNNSVNRQYSYDPNGNATTDGLGNTINYNMLNLPQSIPGKNITFTYDASGQKLRKISGNTVTDYIRGIEYSGGNTINFIATEEGRVLHPTGSPNYEYTLTDHLGNNRIDFDQVNGPVDNTDYYPFGLTVRHQQYAGNKYLYNKKEIQEDLNGQYDYGARFYDPVIARWTSVDPLTEKYRRWSPYNYGVDNPLRYVDPDGMGVNDIIFIVRGQGDAPTKMLTYKGGNLYWNDSGKKYDGKGGNATVDKALKGLQQIEKSNDNVLKGELHDQENSKAHHFFEATPQANGDNVTSKYIDPQTGVVGSQTNLNFDKGTQSEFEKTEKVPASDVGTVAHEMSHGTDFEKGAKGSGNGDEKDPSEIRAVKMENRAREVDGKADRTTYGGKKIDPKKLKSNDN